MSVLAVFDCMVFLQGAARPESPARKCFDLVDRNEVVLFLSPAVWSEIDDVLTRPKTLAMFPTLGRGEVRQFLRAIQAKSRTLIEVPCVFKYERDPKDEPYVNLAIAASARFLVTRDNDLLDLARPNLPQGQDFHNRFPSLRIVTPEQFLAEIGQTN